MQDPKTNTLRWLIKTVGRKNFLIAVLTILSAVNGVTGVFFALLTRRMIDCAAEHDRNGFFRSISFIILLTAGEIALRAVIRLLNEYSKAKIENTFKGRLTDCILHGDYPAVSAVHSGEWINRLTSDTSVIAGAYTELVPGLCGMLMMGISAVAMIITLDYRFACFLVPGGMLLCVVTYAFRKKLKQLHKAIQESDGRLRVFLQECLGSLFMIKAFSAEDRTLTAAEEKMDDHKAARMKRTHFSNFSGTGFSAAMNIMYLGGAFYCAYGILNGTVSYGTFVAITQLISRIQTPFVSISGYIPRYYAMTASAERLMEAERFEREPHPTAEEGKKLAEQLTNNDWMIGLDNVTFTYPVMQGEMKTSPTVLDSFSFSVKKGEYVAFTGHSGCGKSTVLKLLMAMYRPDSGECFIESGGKRELLDVRSRNLFAYVPQGNFLMTGTLRESVTFADPSAADDDSRIMDALRAACADEFIDTLENGLDTLLGERGTGLSEGQTQRIAIARAVFSDRPILLLDESTSALDAVTERRVLENLRSMTDKTVIIITHRPAALEICDRVIGFADDDKVFE